MADHEKGVTTAEDPTQAVLSESGLHSKHLCDYVINVATGCRHGCKFCYVPTTPAVRTRPDMLKEQVDVDNAQHEWGEYVLYRDNLPSRLRQLLERKRTWRSTDKGCGVVGISFSTDCYMDGRAGRITRDTVDILSSNERFSRVLTRNPILALQDIDAFKEAGEFVTIGSSIPSLNGQEVTALEPRAPAPEHRLRGLKKFDEEGVQTFVSMSPTYPTQSEEDLRRLLLAISECEPSVIFHEPINPRGGNFQMTVEAAREAGEDVLADELASLRQRERWVEYSLDHLRTVQKLGQELDLPVHLWPDKQLLKHVSSDTQEWLNSWRERQSPEEFADRDTPSTSVPDLERVEMKA